MLLLTISFFKLILFGELGLSSATARWVPIMLNHKFVCKEYHHGLNKSKDRKEHKWNRLRYWIMKDLTETPTIFRRCRYLNNEKVLKCASFQISQHLSGLKIPQDVRAVSLHQTQLEDAHQLSVSNVSEQITRRFLVSNGNWWVVSLIPWNNRFETEQNRRSTEFGCVGSLL